MTECGRAAPTLFSFACECCGCGACREACPVGAISMHEDECGFVFPRLDAGVCIGCGRCKQVCGFQHKLGQIVGERSYAAATVEGQIERSASGGIFGALARATVARGGVVFGCAYEQGEDGLLVRHRAARTEEELEGLYGSKYVQSSASACFGEVERELRAGREVLFSGTPCQVAGLRGYLGRPYDGLLAVDIVCHGVPSGRMLREYLRGLEGSGARVTDARFRPKRDGWSESLQLELVCADGVRTWVPSGQSSYYDCFLRLETLRDSCYACPFAGSLRPGDLTVGDFWGIEDVRPDLLDDVGGPFSLRRGVSCLLVNTDAGARWLEELGEKIVREPVAFEDVALRNDQLRHPAEEPASRAAYLAAFADGGWGAVEALWRRAVRRRRALQAVKRCVPGPLKRVIKRLLGR